MGATAGHAATSGSGGGSGSAFIAFFPRLAPGRTQRCLAAAVMAGTQAESAALGGPGFQAPVPTLDERLGWDAPAPASSGSPFDFGPAGPHAHTHAHGGTLVLYTRPLPARATAAGQPVYAHTYEVHSWYDVEPGAGPPVAAAWLIAPRRWVVDVDPASDLETGGLSGGQSGSLDTPEGDHDMENKAAHPAAPSRPTHYTLNRLAAHGPRPPFAGSTAADPTDPTFLVLFADYRLSLFAPQRLAAGGGGGGSGDPAQLLRSSLSPAAQPGASSALAVLTASAATSSVVRGDGEGDAVPSHPNAGAQGPTHSRQKRRRISHCVALSLRADDESIWLAYQSEVATRLGAGASDGLAPLPLDTSQRAMFPPELDVSMDGTAPATAPDMPGLVAGGPAGRPLDVATDSPSFAREGWVDLVEIRLDLLGPVLGMLAPRRRGEPNRTADPPNCSPANHRTTPHSMPSARL